MSEIETREFRRSRGWVACLVLLAAFWLAMGGMMLAWQWEDSLSMLLCMASGVLTVRLLWMAWWGVRNPYFRVSPDVLLVWGETGEHWLTFWGDVERTPLTFPWDSVLLLRMLKWAAVDLLIPGKTIRIRLWMLPRRDRQAALEALREGVKSGRAARTEVLADPEEAEEDVRATEG